MNEYLRTKVVATQNPPVVGWWWFWDDHRHVGPVDAAIHRWSMERYFNEVRDG